jgi:hypothetical protein
MDEFGVDPLTIKANTTKSGLSPNNSKSAMLQSMIRLTRQSKDPGLMGAFE